MSVFDVVVIGGGPAGLSAALMLGRCRRRVLICDLGQPRNARSHALHGFLTRDGIAPAELTALGTRELETYGVELRHIGATSARWSGSEFLVSLTDGSDARGRYLLLATGVIDDLPPLPGIEACYGRSVFHCPYCDGWERRDRRLGAYGHGTSGAKLALGLLAWSRDVVLFTGGTRLDRQWLDRLDRHGIGVRSEAIAALEHEDGLLTGVRLRTGDVLARDALFFSTGQHPHSPIAICLGCALTSRGTVKTGTLGDTNVERVFVAGDASRDAQVAIVAAAEGVKAAVAINQALQREELS